MQNVSIARRYARALLDAAGPQADAVLVHLEALVTFFEANHDVWVAVSSPAITRPTRLAALEAIFKSVGNVQPTLVNLLKLLTDRNRTSVLSVLATTLSGIPFMIEFSIPYADLPMLAAFGIVNSALAILLFMIGARHIPAIETALIGVLETPLGPFWVWLAFGIAPGLLTMVGAAIVVGAVVWHIVQDANPAGH